MNGRRFLRRAERLLLPGVVVHELAHALTVVLVPGVSVTEVDLTSHVRHRGRYTITRAFLISYAPLAVNSAVALGSAYYLARISPFAGPRSFLLGVGLAYLAVASALTAFPSYQDAITPLSMLRRQLFTRRAVVLLPATPVVLLVCGPGVTVTYACRAWPALRLGLASLYAVGIALLGLGVVEPPADPAVYGDHLARLLDGLRRLLADATG